MRWASVRSARFVAVRSRLQRYNEILYCCLEEMPIEKHSSWSLHVVETANVIVFCLEVV